MRQDLSDRKNTEITSLHIIDQALTAARDEAEKLDHIFLRYLLRLAHEETLEIIESSQDVNWKEPG